MFLITKKQTNQICKQVEAMEAEVIHVEAVAARETAESELGQRTKTTTKKKRKSDQDKRSAKAGPGRHRVQVPSISSILVSTIITTCRV